MSKSRYVAACLLSQLGLAAVGLIFILAAMIIKGDVPLFKILINTIIFPFIWMLPLLVISLPITVIYGIPVAIILEKRNRINLINLIIAASIPATFIWLAGYRKPEMLYAHAIAVSFCFWFVAYSPVMKKKYWDKESNNEIQPTQRTHD